MSPVQGASRECAAWPKDALRIGFGIIWLIDATLKWLPGFRTGYMDTIMGIRDGQPGWTRWWFDFWINLQHPAISASAMRVSAVATSAQKKVIAGCWRLIQKSNHQRVQPGWPSLIPMMVSM